ncbi:hypothetical protein [Marinimicrobium locisalis]|uniref:hypothetical protein n=1 Tax=Marinimicrobium locisalis TaxID=546022 RepID=UPI0032219DC6
MAIPPSRSEVIAGKSAGTRVVAQTPQIAQACGELAKMARQGDYWATRAVKYISALTSRQMKTVFVREGAKTADNRQVYVLLVPGISLEFSQSPNSDFVIHQMALDSTYAELQKAGKKPGLFKVSKQGDEYQTAPALAIHPESFRVVTVSDRAESIQNAAIRSARAATEPMGRSIIDRAGFDMHYTPGSDRRLGGLCRAEANHPERLLSIRESAVLLAKAMEESRNIEGVYWISEGGGSGVLTHAMHLLKTRNVNFDGTGHHIFFSQYATNLVKAQNLAYDLGLEFERKAYSLGYRSASLDAIRAPLNRRRKEPENYSRLQMSADLCKGPQVIIGGVAVLSGVGLAGPGGFLIGAGVAGFTALNALTRAITPGAHERIKGKF